MSVDIKYKVTAKIRIFISQELTLTSQKGKNLGNMYFQDIY